MKSDFPQISTQKKKNRTKDRENYRKKAILVFVKIYLLRMKRSIKSLRCGIECRLYKMCVDSIVSTEFRMRIYTMVHKKSAWFSTLLTKSRERVSKKKKTANILYRYKRMYYISQTYIELCMLRTTACTADITQIQPHNNECLRYRQLLHGTQHQNSKCCHSSFGFAIRSHIYIMGVFDNNRSNVLSF